MLAKRDAIPATVRGLTDAQALERQVIELSLVGKGAATDTAQTLLRTVPK